MAATLALLPSPLLGPAVWRPVAARLAGRGWQVATVPLTRPAPATPDDVLAAFLDATPEHDDVVLVPHSNAGLYVPALVGNRRVVGVVFVDAGVPPPAGDVRLAPVELLEALAPRTDDEGLLPAWTAWWADDSVDALFPHRRTRRRVEREQPRLPLSYLSATMAVPAGWDAVMGAYLAFGETYAEDRQRAADLGWPTRTLPAEHLHMLIEPQAVASTLEELLDAIGLRPAQR